MGYIQTILCCYKILTMESYKSNHYLISCFGFLFVISYSCLKQVIFVYISPDIFNKKEFYVRIEQE